VSINDAGRLCVHAEPEDVFCAQCATDTLLELNNRVNELEYTKASLRARIAELEDENERKTRLVELRNASIQGLRERLAKAEKLAEAVELRADDDRCHYRTGDPDTDSPCSRVDKHICPPCASKFAAAAFRAVSESQEKMK
jgi:predicted  nucleic acid-binding Zn-ribbon protein